MLRTIGTAHQRNVAAPTPLAAGLRPPPMRRWPSPGSVLPTQYFARHQRSAPAGVGQRVDHFTRVRAGREVSRRGPE
jgi:hypothetical protein